MKQQSPKILILGPQGAGKGTQAGRLARLLHIPHISAGDLVRDVVASGTPLGKRLGKTINGGNLIPATMMNAMIKQRLGHADCRRGWILDGYPRSGDQAHGFNRFGHPNMVIVLHYADHEAIRRLAGRRMCPRGHVYHLRHDPPRRRGRCDHDGLPLKQRDDDTPRAIRKRLRIYHHDTEPIIKLYDRAGIVIQINASPTIPMVYRSLLTALKKLPWLSSRLHKT